jgi:hypothetical protein
MISARFGKRDEIAAILCNQDAIFSDRIVENRLIRGTGAECPNNDYTLNVVAALS